MSDEWTDEAVGEVGAKPSPARSAAPAARAPRNVEHESITIGSLSARPDEAGEGVEQEAITIGRRGGRVFSENARRMLANIDKHGMVGDQPATKESPPAAAGAADAGASVASPAAATPAAATAAPAETRAAPDPSAEHRERADRLQAHNQRLVNENAELKKRGASREPTAREKALDEIERTYLDNPLVAIRRLAQLAIGADTPDHKDVDDELRGLYQDFTERELSVPMDPARKAAREAAQTRRLLDREKRERKAEAAPPASAPDDTEAKQDEQYVSVVSNLLTADKAAEKYPLMMKHASALSGMKPEALVWKAIVDGVQTGEFNADDPNEKLIEAASRKIENHYKSIADLFGVAPSTAATTTQATVSTDSKAEPQGNGPRTITNASASVAPATPPAKKPDPTPDEKPKYRNERERRRTLADKHFGS